MTTSDTNDSWHEADPYELYMGRWSRLIADEFVRWLDLPPSLRWLDVGCGTGALSASIVAQCSPALLTGVEPSADFIAAARKRLGNEVRLTVGTATNLPVPDASVDVIVSGLMLNFVPSPANGLAEMRRKAVAGGTIAAYVWDYTARMELIRYFWDAAVELNPSARPLDEGIRFPLCLPDALTRLFQHAGLTEIAVAPLEIRTSFQDFDDYWRPFLGGQGPAPAYAMSLDGTERSRLRNRIRERLPIQADGAISLIARAWAVRSRVPA